MPEFTMPSLGADMDEGTVTEWLVKPGDQVHHGDIVAVIDTAKAAVEVECFTDGTIETLLVPPGSKVPVGTPLAVITPAGAPAKRTPQPKGPPAPAPRPVLAPEPAGAPHVTSPLVRHLAEAKGIDLTSVTGTGPAGTITRADIERAAAPAPPPPGPPQPAPPPPARPAPVVRPQASPLARRLARELGVDLRNVAGTGAHSTIRAQDVRHAAETITTAGQVVRTTPARPAVREPTGRPAGADRQAAMRQTIGKLMARSKREIPHFYLTTTIDMTTAMGWLRDRNRELAMCNRLVPAALLLKATALAAREFPELNGHWIDDRFVPGAKVHIGVAISLRGGGLVAPALHNTAELDLASVMAGLRDLVTRARGGRLRGSELTDATITVTNLGDQGVESVTGVIYPPQVALVGFGKIVERPWAVNGLLGVRPLVTATLAADHRVTDGYLGARFLNMVTEHLQRPEDL